MSLFCLPHSRPRFCHFSWMTASKTASRPRKTPLFMDRIIYMQCSIRKTPCFTDGALKFASPIRNLAEFTDRTTFPHPMNDLFPTRADGRSLRKTFGRQVYNMNNENSELALVKLMKLFNHSSVAITKRYLGLRQEEIL